MRVLFAYEGYENLGLEYMSAVLKQHGHETALAFDPALFRDTYVLNRPFAWLLDVRDRLVEQARRFQPDVIAFGVVTPMLPWALDLARRMKDATGAPVVFGGLHVSGAPLETMSNDVVDFAMVGEADFAFLRLVEVLRDRGDLSTVPNLLYRADGRVIRNPLGPFPDVDVLPWPDKDLFFAPAPESNYGYTAISGRGCHMRCTFCVNSFTSGLSSRGENGYLRRRKVDDVIAELTERRDRYHFDHVRFYDDCLTFDGDWFEDFATKYATKVNLPYWCFSNPDTLDERRVRLLELSGCYELQMGVQTFSEHTRRTVLNRHETNTQIANAIQLFKNSRVSLAVDNIINLPGQTEEELLDLADFYADNRPKRVNMYWLTAFPGTRIIPIAIESGHMTTEQAKKLVVDPHGYAMHINRAEGRQDLGRLHAYVIFSTFFPKRWLAAMRRRRLFRFFPSSGTTFLQAIAYRMRAPTKFAHLEKRTLRRYWRWAWRGLHDRVRDIFHLKVKG